MENDIIRHRQGSFLEPGQNPAVCLRCAASGTTCCRISGHDAIVAPISEIEWQEIITRVPWAAAQGFVEVEANSPGFVEQMGLLFPRFLDGVQRAFPVGGTHLRPATDVKGQCAFSGAGGCLLPRQVRPVFCHIYPFWFNGEQLQVFSDTGCLALRDAGTVPELCQLLETTPEQLRRHYIRLCQCWGVTPSRLR
ncbi:MAG: hypothetical protein OEV91_00845 [Desulfobulbaceae bacterium]|nr:hypothetical protein [Desulfobulbaceae bacterium]